MLQRRFLLLGFTSKVGGGAPILVHSVGEEGERARRKVLRAGVLRAGVRLVECRAR